MAGRLEGKVAIVTGGANGIGRATAELFHAEGAKVVLSDIQDDRGAELAETLGEGAIYQRADVLNEAEVAALVDTAVSRFGRLDAMFNNAGAPGTTEPLAEVSAEAYDFTMNLLVRSVFFGIKHAAPVMVKQGSGSIINTASVAGIEAGYGPHIYSTAKAAVMHLTRTTAMELGRANVRVNAICPGFIATRIIGLGLGYAQQVAERTPDALEPIMREAQPIPRAGEPMDIAKAALFLASDDSSFVNAHSLVVDGGMTGGSPNAGKEEMGDMLRLVIDEALKPGV